MGALLFYCVNLVGPELGGKVMFLSALWSCYTLWHHRRLMRLHLKQHGASHEFSPNLRRIVDEVCKAAGRDPARVPLYDYSLSRPRAEVSPSVVRKLSRFLLEGSSHSAATTGDMLMVSVPLLKLLDDGEEHAIMAHEMAHIVLGHAVIGGLLWMVRMMIFHTAAVYWLLAIWQGGWTAVGIAACLPLTFTFLFRSWFPAWKKKGRLTPQEAGQRGWAQIVYVFTYYPVLFSLLGLFAPGVLTAYLIFGLVANAAAIMAGLASQSRERQADAGAVALGCDPLALAMALRKIVFLQDRAQQKLFESKRTVKRGGFLQLYATHPTLEERVETLCRNAYRSGISWARAQEVKRGDINLPADHDIPEDVVRAFNNM